MSDKSKNKNKLPNNQYKDLLKIFAISFPIIYILLELTFNLSLIDFLNSKNTSMEVFNNFELIGKILSSFGIALFLSKLILLFKNVEKVWAYGVFFLALVISFSGQTLIFNKILDDMSAEQKLSAYSFGVYRNLHLNEQVNVKVFNNKDPSYDNVVNSLLGLFKNNPTMENRIIKSSELFFYAENKLDPKELSKVYDELNITLPNIDEYWKLYYIESRRYEVYRGLFQKQYYQNFTKSIGMPPSLPKEEFIKRLKKDSASLTEFSKVVLIPAKPEFHLKELKLGDIPEGLNKQQWINFINNHINYAIERNSFTAKNVEILPNSKAIISSVVIAPISIMLSLVLLLLNIVIFMAQWTKIGALILLSIFIGIIFTGSYNPYGFNKNTAQLLEFEVKLTKVMAGYKNTLHILFDNPQNNHPYKIVKIEKPTLPQTDNLKAELNNKFKELRATGNQISYAETQQSFTPNTTQKENPFNK